MDEIDDLLQSIGLEFPSTGGSLQTVTSRTQSLAGNQSTLSLYDGDRDGAHVEIGNAGPKLKQTLTDEPPPRSLKPIDISFSAAGDSTVDAASRSALSSLLPAACASSDPERLRNALSAVAIAFRALELKHAHAEAELHRQRCLAETAQQAAAEAKDALQREAERSGWFEYLLAHGQGTLADAADAAVRPPARAAAGATPLPAASTPLEVLRGEVAEALAKQLAAARQTMREQEAAIAALQGRAADAAAAEHASLAGLRGEVARLNGEHATLTTLTDLRVREAAAAEADMRAQLAAACEERTAAVAAAAAAEAQLSDVSARLEAADAETARLATQLGFAEEAIRVLHAECLQQEAGAAALALELHKARAALAAERDGRAAAAAWGLHGTSEAGMAVATGASASVSAPATVSASGSRPEADAPAPQATASTADAEAEAAQLAALASALAAAEQQRDALAARLTALEASSAQLQGLLTPLPAPDDCPAASSSRGVQTEEAVGAPAAVHPNPWLWLSEGDSLPAAAAPPPPPSAAALSGAGEGLSSSAAVDSFVAAERGRVGELRHQTAVLVQKLQRSASPGASAPPGAPLSGAAAIPGAAWLPAASASAAAIVPTQPPRGLQRVSQQVLQRAAALLACAASGAEPLPRLPPASAADLAPLVQALVRGWELDQAAQASRLDDRCRALHAEYQSKLELAAYAGRLQAPVRGGGRPTSQPSVAHAPATLAVAPGSSVRAGLSPQTGGVLAEVPEAALSSAAGRSLECSPSLHGLHGGMRLLPACPADSCTLRLSQLPSSGIADADAALADSCSGTPRHADQGVVGAQRMEPSVPAPAFDCSFVSAISQHAGSSLGGSADASLMGPAASPQRVRGASAEACSRHVHTGRDAREPPPSPDGLLADGHDEPTWGPGDRVERAASRVSQAAAAQSTAGLAPDDTNSAALDAEELEWRTLRPITPA